MYKISLFYPVCHYNQLLKQTHHPHPPKKEMESYLWQNAVLQSAWVS